MSLIKEIENKAVQYNFIKDNLLERFTAIVAVPTRKGIEDWVKKEIFPEEHNKELFNLLYMERGQYSELSERLSYFMQWVDNEIKEQFRSLEEKSTLREVAKKLMELFPEFK